MEKRGLVKINRAEYRKLNKIIRSLVKLTKERWMKEKCEDMEELEEKHDIFHKII